jgi:SAM-dependent MidA family methyltransferase
MSRLEEIIKKDIKSNGPVTFARFMEAALYHPRYGYYTSAENPIGRQGDFYTAPTASPLFGAMLARQFHEMWRLAGRPAHWVLVEYGPGTGVLARDVVDAAARDHPEFYEHLEYYLVEISAKLREKQRNELASSAAAATKCKWAGSLDEIRSSGQSIGCVFANELVDAFPVHLVKKNNHSLRELYVDIQDDGFYFLEGPLSRTELAGYFKMQHVELAPGQRAEVNLQARDWLAHVAAGLSKGFLLIIDYGLTAPEMYSPQRFNGTLRCFRRHRLVEDPLVNPGGQDITAHVNFTALAIWGRELDLTKLGLVTQPRFLLNLGILDTLKEHSDYTSSPEVLKKTGAIKQLVLPGGMGNIFKVLAFCKGFDHLPGLTGLK